MDIGFWVLLLLLALFCGMLGGLFSKMVVEIIRKVRRRRAASNRRGYE